METQKNFQKRKGGKLSVVIPAYNEAATIERILGKVFAVGLPEGIEREVIVVDDASKDGTAKIVEKNWGTKVRLKKHAENMGKGAAVKTGFIEATGDFVVIQDADLEYNPSDWLLMLEPILAGEADVVFGSRLVSQRPHRVLYFWHYLGNKTLTFFSNMFSNLNLTDMETCYKMFTREVVDGIKHKLSSRRFGIEPEITARVKKYRVYEIGISYAGRTYKEGKKIGWRDGVAAIWHIVRFNWFDIFE